MRYWQIISFKTISPQVAVLILMLFLAAASAHVSAGAYVFAGDTNGLDLITHPSNYDGTGGEVEVSVCIDPNAANASAMEIPVKNIVATLNAFVPRSPNLIFGNANNIPVGQFDFESLTLHEFGHCLSLSHPNQGNKTGVAGTNTDATQGT